MEEMLGYGPGELVGQSTKLLYENAHDWADHGAAIYQLITTGRTAQGEREVVRKDGRALWVSYFGRAVDPNDVEQGAVWVAYDISERKRNEAALERALSASTSISPTTQVSSASRPNSGRSS